uniref:E-beta-farnesene synthase n=1 Tax=Tanacetum cinerariifolium TaxID=118510 RepID=A0A699H1K2_TANCI|nr:hypothetical protein [Tanacetum cinerariifolium]
MADVHVNAPADQAPTMAPHTRTDDQILPHIRWVPIGKSNCYLDVERALTTIINLCLTEKTSGFERPRAPVLQILWGIVNRAHIDYAERIWEEFTQSIHTFIEDKKNLAQHTYEKKNATLIVISSISAKGTKREVFGMPIPDNLITADIQGEPYYKEYLEKVAKHQRYLAGIPEKVPRFDDEEADIQRALEESLKSVYDAPRGPLPPVVIREPESGKYQPLLKVQGKSKEKFIFQRHTSIPIESSGHDESLSLYVELGLTDSEVESDEDVPRVDAGAQDKGQAGPNPADVAASQPQSSHVVHAGPNLKHTDLEATDENLKLMVEEQMILEEPASSTGTLSSLQYLTKDLSFGDLFFNDKPSEANNEKGTTETKAESMVSVIIQQDTSVIPPMTTPIIDFTSRPDSPNVHRALQATTTETTMTTRTTHPPPPQP